MSIVVVSDKSYWLTDLEKDYLFRKAARKGDIEKMIIYREAYFPWSNETCKASIEGNQREALKWLIINRCPFEIDECIEYASILSRNSLAGYLKILKRIDNQLNQYD